MMFRRSFIYLTVAVLLLLCTWSTFTVAQTTTTTTTTPAKATPAKASAQKTLQPAQKPAAATTPTTAAVTPAPAPTPAAKKGDIKQAKKAAAQQKQPAATQPAPAAATKSQPAPKADPPANSGNNNNNNNNGNGNGAPTVIVRQPPPKSGFKMPFWLPWAIAFGAFVCILFLAVFVFQDAAMKCVGCIETTCYWTFRTILMPFKFLWWLTRTICYPIKQCFLSVKDRCSRHYYPAEQKVSGLDYQVKKSVPTHRG